MKAAYKWLAFAIAVEVVVQAAVILYGYASLGKYVDDGALLHGVNALAIFGFAAMTGVRASRMQNQRVDQPV